MLSLQFGDEFVHYREQYTSVSDLPDPFISAFRRLLRVIKTGAVALLPAYQILRCCLGSFPISLNGSRR